MYVFRPEYPWGNDPLFFQRYALLERAETFLPEMERAAGKEKLYVYRNEINFNKGRNKDDGKITTLTFDLIL